MDLIVETDIGHDPDDFFALCYLFSAEVNIRAILLTPGDESQVTIVSFLLKELGMEHIPIGVPTLGRRKERLTSIHKYFVEKYKYSSHLNKYHLGDTVLTAALSMYPDSELFVCGPVKNIGNYFIKYKEYKIAEINKAVMQGGFIGYGTHGINVPKIKKFVGKKTVPTFNLNGDIKGAQAYLNANIKERWFISKNVCHTIIYNEDIHRRIMDIPARNRAAEIFREGMTVYLKRHTKGKKFHDPSAAVCHLHPEIATWVKAKLYQEKGAWGSRLDGKGDNIIININYNKLWDYIAKGI